MKAIILAAGLGTRLGELTKTIPKCLVKINEKSILENQLENLTRYGIDKKDISIVIGKQGECWTEENYEKIRNFCKNVIVNPLNKSTNNSYSLRLALDSLNNEDLIIIDGDLAFSYSLLEKIIMVNQDAIISKRIISKDPGNRLIVDSNFSVLSVDRKANSDLLYGAMIKIKSADFTAFKELIKKEEYLKLDTGFLLNEFCKIKPLKAIVEDSWVNINTPLDLEYASKLFSKNFVAFMYGYTAVGKSTVAKSLAKIPNTVIFHSAVVRKELGLSNFKNIADADKFFDYNNNLRLEVDKKVYTKLAENAKNAIAHGKNVVLDAGYFFQWQRELVYRAIKDSNAELFAIKVRCDDEVEIKRRLNERAKKFGKDPLSETPSWNTYLATKKITQPLNIDKTRGVNLNVLSYNSQTKEIQLETSNNGENSSIILENLRKL